MPKSKGTVPSQGIRRSAKAVHEPPTISQVLMFVAAIIMQLATIIGRMDKQRVQYWIGAQSKLGRGLSDLLLQGKSYDELLLEWVRFYREVFGLELDPTTVTLPQEREGFGWLVVVAPGLGLNQIWRVCRSRFTCWSYHGDNLEATISHHDRSVADRSYAIRLRDRIEADEELKSLSLSDLQAQGIAGITLPERLLLELWYHWKTGSHLDSSSWTMCSGSRYSDGSAPSVRWRSGCREFRVGWCLLSGRDDHLRARAVVS